MIDCFVLEGGVLLGNGSDLLGKSDFLANHSWRLIVYIPSFITSRAVLCSSGRNLSFRLYNLPYNLLSFWLIDWLNWLMLVAISVLLLAPIAL